MQQRGAGLGGPAARVQIGGNKEHARAPEIDKLRQVRFGAYAFFFAVVIWFGHRPATLDDVAAARAAADAARTARIVVAA